MATKMRRTARAIESKLSKACAAAKANLNIQRQNTEPAKAGAMAEERQHARSNRQSPESGGDHRMDILQDDEMGTDIRTVARSAPRRRRS